MNEKQKALNEAIKQLEKLDIVIKRLGDTKIEPIEVIPTGSLCLDLALGVGGYPRGRIIELFGPEMSGKSTLSLIGIANAQKDGGIAVLIDAEHSFDPIWASKLGVNVKDLRIYQPDYGEQALEAVDKLASSNAVDMIVVDSTAALIPKAELEGSMEDQSVGLQARLISKALRKIVGSVGKSKTVVIFVNQIRQNVMQMFGDPTVTPGGRALKFYSSIRLEVHRLTGKDNVFKDKDDNVIGHRVRVKVAKNKCAPPFRVCEFDLYFDRGIDCANEIAQLAIDKGIVKAEGKVYTFNNKKWIGFDNYCSFVKDNPELQNTLKEHIINVDKKARSSELSVT